MPDTESTASIAKALIISQDAQANEAITQSLAQLAISVEPCPQVPEALLRLNCRKFEAVIVDLQLGDQATAVLQQVRSSASNRTAVVFAIGSVEEDAATAFKIGAGFVLKRPLSLESISHTLKAAYGLIVRERRRYFRYPISIPAAIRQDNGDAEGRTVNISEGGMAIIVAVPLIADKVNVQFMLPGQPSQFAVKAVRCWQEGNCVGLQFVSLPPQQKSELQEWLSCRLEEQLPQPVAQKFQN
jgi:DNA-binding response OmpR family regulator